MIGGLRDLRTQLLIVAGVLGLLDLIAAVVLMSPMGRSRAEQQHRYEQLRQEKIEKMQAGNPVEGMDKKIETARKQEIEFNHERVPERYSAMSDALSHIAGTAGVSVSDVKYDERKIDDRAIDKPPAGYEDIGITIQVHGTYEQDMRFINAVERQKMMLIIDAVSFEGLKGDILTVSVHMSTYRRTAA